MRPGGVVRMSPWRPALPSTTSVPLAPPPPSTSPADLEVSRISLFIASTSPTYVEPTYTSLAAWSSLSSSNQTLITLLDYT